MKKIDIHCHTSPRPINDCANVDATMNNIAIKMREHEIRATVLLATYFPHKGTGISNFRLRSWINMDRHTQFYMDRYTQFYMFGSLDFEHYFYQGYNELEELAGMKAIKGIKIYTCYQQVDIESRKFYDVMNLASDYGLPVMFHAGVSYAAYRKYKKKTIANMHTAKTLSKVAESYPQINFIFSHLSKPNFEDMEHAAFRYPNVYSDMSGLIDSKHNRDDITYTVKMIINFLDACGPDKLLFGTDFPVQTHEDSVYFVEQAMMGYSEEDKKKVYYDNAAKLLGL